MKCTICKGLGSKNGIPCPICNVNSWNEYKKGKNPQVFDPSNLSNPFGDFFNKNES